MRKSLVAGTALAGSLLMSTFIWQTAQAASAPALKGALGNSSTVTLVDRNGAVVVVVVAVVVVAAAVMAVAVVVAAAVMAGGRWWWWPRR